MQLSERAKQLIPLSRIVSFATWKRGETAAVVEIFQKADDESRYLTDGDLAQIKTQLPDLAKALDRAKLLREKAEQIVEDSRQQVLAKYPGIAAEGGDLYPPERAEACWRDFWHFLRCITYGIAGKTIPFTSPEGLKNMQLLYQELRVPLDAMRWGLLSLKTVSLEQFSPEEQSELSVYFDHLIEAMQQF